MNSTRILSEVRNVIRPILKAVENWDLVVHEVSYPDEDFITGAVYRGKEEYRRISRKELRQSVAEYLTHNYWGKKADLPTTFEDVKALFLESQENEYGHTRLLTVKEAKKAKAEKKFKRMEEAASSFAASCKYRLGTMEFLRALDKAVNDVEYHQERWNNHEVRMEEWAACMHSGAGRDAYYSDHDYVNGQYDERLASLQEVWEYVERKFPLLMLRYKERKARL